MNRADLQFWTRVWYLCIPMRIFAAQELTETNRPSFAAANQVMTLTRVTNKRLVYRNWVDLLQVNSVHVLWTSLDRRCFTVCEVATDWCELMEVSEPLMVRTSCPLPASRNSGTDRVAWKKAYHRPNHPHTRPSRCTAETDTGPTRPNPLSWRPNPTQPSKQNKYNTTLSNSFYVTNIQVTQRYSMHINFAA